jgi:hypothetical protein
MSLLAAIPIVNKALDLIFPDPKVAMEHKIAVLKLDQDGAFKELDADLQLALAQIAVNNEEAKSDSLLKSGWRPMVGWVCVAGAASELSAMLDDWARLPHDVKNATSKAVFVAWHENIDTDMTTRCQRVAAAVMAAAKSANA